MTRRFPTIFLGALAFFGAASAANAVVVTYDLASLGGNQYRYDYTVTNDGAITNEVKLFDILFDPALYDESSLTVGLNPALSADWDQLFLSSGLLVPAAYDVFALGDGIAVGESVSGFSVQFAWLGLELPGAQGFELYDPETFDLLGTGTTTFRPTTTVPEPETSLLFMLGFMGLAWSTRSRRCAWTDSRAVVQ